MHCNQKPAIVLTSGGLDSTTCLAMARHAGFSPLYSMTFDYGQRHRHELAAAEAVAHRYEVAEHRVIRIDLRQFGKSALTSDIEVPRDQIDVDPRANAYTLVSPLIPSPGTPGEGREGASCGQSSGTPSPTLPRDYAGEGENPICVCHDVDPRDGGETGREKPQDVPITYVPARNTIFLSYALAWAEVLEVLDIFIGVNAVDYSGYPDCRPEFINAFQAMANLATRMTTRGGATLKVHAPLLELSKAEIIRRGIELGVDYSMTHSCYDPDPTGAACGHCDSCLLRKNGFAQAGVSDPTRYASAGTPPPPPPGGASAGDSAK